MSEENNKVIKRPSNLPSLPKPGSVLKMPKPKLFRQLVVFVLDGSGSMTQPGASMASKGTEVDEAIRQVFDRLSKSKHSNCFDINAIAFSSKVNEFMELTPFEEIEPIEWSFDPTKHVGNYRTYALDAIEMAVETAHAYLEEHSEMNRKALIILLTDGLLDDHEEVTSFLEEQDSEDVFTATVYFKTEWNERQKEVWDTDELDDIAVKILKDIASLDKLAWEEMNAETVREAMIKSMSIVSQTTF